METRVITIKPPLQIVDIGNGCKAYSTSIYIPAKSELTTTLQSITRSQFFLDYNFNYTNVSNFLVWHKTSFATTDEIKTLKAKMLKLPTMSMHIFKNVLGNIDENYPFSMSPKLILALLVLTGICTIVIGILFIWYKRKTSFTSSTMGNILKLIPSLKEKIPTLDSLLPILSELAPSQNTKKMLLLLSLFLNYRKLHLMNIYYHLYWFQNYNWKNHLQQYLFHIVHPIWIQCLRLQLITNLNHYHWKCLIVLPPT